MSAGQARFGDWLRCVMKVFEGDCSPKGGHKFVTALIFFAILLLTWLVYIPGRSGGFLFDDWSNLALLGHQGFIDSFNKFVGFLLTGFAGPAGRPVSLASFLLNANTWPADPRPFKLTNILIHVLNGALLAGVILQLVRRLGVKSSDEAWIAVLGAGLWLLHPLWVSTTLYIVQRMTMLAATFVFASLIVYLHGRRLMATRRAAAGYAWASFAVVGLGLLAVLSKENGALLPLLILIIERYAPESIQTSPPGWRVWKAVFVQAPALLLLGYLALFLPELIHGNAGARDFTPGQRLLTEGRILWDYIGLLLLPRPYSGGLFTDSISVSTGLLTPFSTFLGWLGIVALVVMAERLRRKVPVVSVTIMFFLAGHVLESTWLQLELRFEHRNYLPAALLFLPVAWWLVLGRGTNRSPNSGLSPPRSQAQGDDPSQRGHPFLTRRLRVAVALAMCSLLAGETLMGADLWGRPFAQALFWARQSPDSPRAQSHLANLWTHAGNHAEAERLLRQALERHPGDLLLLAGVVGTQCQSGDLLPETREELFHALRTTHPAYVVARFQADKTLSFLRQGGCRAVDQTEFEQLLDAAQENPLGGSVAPWRQMLLQQRAQLRLIQRRPQDAFADLMSAAAAVPSQDGVLAGAALLASQGQPALALRFLDTAPRPDEKSAANGPWVERLRLAWQRHTNYYPHEFQELRKTIEQDLMAQKAGGAVSASLPGTSPGAPPLKD